MALALLQVEVGFPVGCLSCIKCLPLGFFLLSRGNTLKNIEKECNAKIMIRGKGSVKEGKVGRKDGQMLPGEDEPLHALVTANTMENVKKAVEQVKGRPLSRNRLLWSKSTPV